jgi:2,3-diketo-5-methylthiopentyl-1-phosphate enolase
MFSLSETIRGADYLLATYYLSMPAEADVLGKAAGYAVGQTIGTWIEVPGVTDEMRDRHRGRVVKVLEAPPVDLSTQAEATSGYFIQIALPTVNFGAAIFYDTALGGVDLIKDDELLGNPPFSPVVDRVKAYLAAADRARDVTGRDVVYIPNVTDRPDRMLDTARRAVDAGARAVMIAYASAGFGSLQSLAESIGVPILAHYAGVTPYFEGPGTGLSAPIALGMLPRLAGGDMVLTITPYGGYPLRRLQYLKMVQQLQLSRPHIAPAFPVVGGGVHPGTVQTYVDELGPDIILGAGGAIQGHPDGAAAGADAMRQAIDAVMAGRSVVEAGQEHPALGRALDRFGTTV